MAAKKSTKPSSAKSAKKPSKKSQKTKSDRPVVPTLRSNLARSRKIFSKNRRSIILAALIYGLLYFVFVRAITNVDLAELRSTINLLFGNGQETLGTRAVLVGTLFGESINLDQSSGFYFVTLYLINSLAFIWLLRHIWAGRKTSVKEAYYQGMYPLVPSILVGAFVLIQLIPFTIGSYIMQVTLSNGIALGLAEKLGVVSIFILGVMASAYWVAGTIVAAYAVTVPGMNPMAALRRAREILKGRRFLVARQMIAFMALSALIGLTLMLGVVYVWPDASIVAVTILVILSLPWFQFYFYGLYRDLLNE